MANKESQTIHTPLTWVFPSSISVRSAIGEPTMLLAIDAGNSSELRTSTRGSLDFFRLLLSFRSVPSPLFLLEFPFTSEAIDTAALTKPFILSNNRGRSWCAASARFKVSALPLLR